MKKVTQLFFALAIAASATVSCSKKPLPPTASSRTNVVEVTVSIDDPAWRLARQNVFVILPFTPERTRTGGTGFLVHTREHGPLIITNRHVCEAMEPTNTVYYLERGQQLFVARRLHASDRTDLCAIVAPPELYGTGFNIASKDPAPGEQLHVYGHPYLNPLTHTQGRFLNITREPLRFHDSTFSPDAVFLMGRVDFMVHPGNSGSPILNEQNEVVGVIFAMEGGNHHGLFIPLAELLHFLNTLE